MEYNVCFFVHFVFLGAHVGALSLPLSPAGTFSCISYVWIIIDFSVFVLANQFDLIWFAINVFAVLFSDDYWERRLTSVWVIENTRLESAEHINMESLLLVIPLCCITIGQAIALLTRH